MEKVSRRTKYLHWGTAVLIGLTYSFIELRVFFEKGTSTRELFKNTHYFLGITILFLIILRFIQKRKTPSTYTNQNISQQRRSLMNKTHQGFLIWFCAMAVLGVMQILPEWGLSEIPYSQTVKLIHQRMGQVGYFLISIHVTLVFYHHLWLKDDVLKRYL